MRLKFGKEFILLILKDLKIYFWAFLLFAAISIISALIFDKVPILLNYGLYGDSNFWASIVANLHNSLLDIFIFSVLITMYLKKTEIEREVRGYADEIEKYRGMKDELACHLIIHSIKKLNEYNVERINLTDCFLVDAKLLPVDKKPLKLVKARLMGANLTGAKMNFIHLEEAELQGVNLDNTQLKGAHLNKAMLKNIKCNNTNFEKARLDEANLKKAKLENSNFSNAMLKRADLEGASFKDSVFHHTNFKEVSNLDVQKLLEAKSLKNAKLDQTVKDYINRVKPELLRN